MATYVEIVEEVKNFLVTAITELTIETSAVADIDVVVDALYDDADTNVGLVIDFLYAVPHLTDSGRRSKDIWDTYIGGLLVLQYTGRDDTETNKNTLLELLYRAFDGGTTKILSGTDKVMIVRIERPEKAAIGEHPFYFMPFTLQAIHGGRS